VRVMRLVLPTYGDRVAPVLDAASTFLLIAPGEDGALHRRELVIAEPDPVAKARRIAELGAEVLICGAISWPLETMLTSAGMRVIPNTGGAVQHVIVAFYAGELTERAFLLPGCPGRQRRQRHRHGWRWRNG